MAGKPHPYKGIPRDQWPKGAIPKKSKPIIAPPDYDPNVVRASLQPPEAAPAGVFPQKQNEAEVADAPQGWDENNIPPNLFSGDQKHLEVMGKNGSFTDPIPGFKLYWFDAKNGVRIAMAQRSGYEFVNKDEVLLNDGLEGGDDLGNHVRKIGNIFGGPTEDGKPQYLYLMKKPKWLVDRHNMAMEEVNQKYEEMLRRGEISRNPSRDRQFAGGSDMAVQSRSNLPRIEIADGLYRQRN